MGRRTGIVRNGLIYKRKSLVRTSAGILPKVSSLTTSSAAKKTAFRNVRVMRQDYHKKIWKFKLYRDNDDTIRYTAADEGGVAGAVKKPSGTLIDPTMLKWIKIESEGERLEQLWALSVEKVAEYVYVLKNKRGETFDYTQTLATPDGDRMCPWSQGSVGWIYNDNGANVPYNMTGSFNTYQGTIYFEPVYPQPGLYTGIYGNYKIYDAEGQVLIDRTKYWTLSDNGIWYYDNTVDDPENPTTGSYNPNTGYYTININYVSVYNKFWIRYDTLENGIESLYPYKYKREDQYNLIDQVEVGKYSGNIPYWEIDLNYQFDPASGSFSGCPTNAPFVGSLESILEVYGVPVRKYRRVKTSVPYKGFYTLRLIIHSMRGMQQYDCSGESYCSNIDQEEPLKLVKIEVVDSPFSYYEPEYGGSRRYYNDSEFKARPSSINTWKELSVKITPAPSGWQYVCRVMVWDEENERWVLSHTETRTTNLSYIKSYYFSRDATINISYDRILRY